MSQDRIQELILERLSKIDVKVDKLDDRIASIDRTLAVNTESLVQHMRRTALLEDDLKPVKKHVNRLDGAMKTFAFISLVVAILAGIMRVLGIFN